MSQEHPTGKPLPSGRGAVTDLVATVGARTYTVESWEQVSTAYRRAILTLQIADEAAPHCVIIDARTSDTVAHARPDGHIIAADGRTLYAPRSFEPRGKGKARWWRTT